MWEKSFDGWKRDKQISAQTGKKFCNDINALRRKRFSLSRWAFFKSKQSLFVALMDRIPAATQRGCSDALISHTGQRRGQHTRTSLPVSPPCLQPLLYTDFVLIPLPAFFLQIPSVCLSGSRSAAFPDPEKRRNLRERDREKERERERGGLELLSQSVDPGLEGKRANTMERIEGGSREG